jgi:hypothetical protein
VSHWYIRARDAGADQRRWLLRRRIAREYLRGVRVFRGWRVDGIDAQAVGADTLVDRRARDYAARVQPSGCQPMRPEAI